MSAEPDSISLVLPTYNRLAALQENLPALLELEGVTEVVVVVDGSTDGSAEWLAELADPRLRTIVQAQQGSPAARNQGVQAATGSWILMTEDDCVLPRDFVTTLRAVAAEQAAQIVSAPWLTTGDETMTQALTRARARPQPAIGLYTHPGVFPDTDHLTPFLNGIFLAHRSVFATLRYRAFGGNAWREETDLFLTATELGFRCVLTPRTASFQLSQWEGGQRRSRLRYEAWVIRNNWAFLRRHAELLRRLGQIRGPIGAQAAFVATRVAAVLAGSSRARLDQLTAAWRRRSRRQGGRTGAG